MYVYYISTTTESTNGRHEFFVEKGLVQFQYRASESRWMVPGTVSVDD